MKRRGKVQSDAGTSSSSSSSSGGAGGVSNNNNFNGGAGVVGLLPCLFTLRHPLDEIECYKADLK